MNGAVMASLAATGALGRWDTPAPVLEWHVRAGAVVAQRERLHPRTATRHHPRPKRRNG